MIPMHQIVLLLGAGVAIFTTSAMATSVVLRVQPLLLAGLRQATLTPSSLPTLCQTIATDPNPPLNVRSSPVVAPDNIVGKLRNGTRLTVIDESEGWLRISNPIDGWVYQELTVTSCVPLATKNQAESDKQLLIEATEYYQAGNLKAAVALVQTIPATSSFTPVARQLTEQWQRDWAVAETKFYLAQAASAEGRWQDILQLAKNLPANRFWRSRMTPIVKRAIQNQATTK